MAQMSIQRRGAMLPYTYWGFYALKKFSLKQIFSIRCQVQFFFRSNKNYKTNYFPYSFAAELAQHLWITKATKLKPNEIATNQDFVLHCGKTKSGFWLFSFFIYLPMVCIGKCKWWETLGLHIFIIRIIILSNLYVILQWLWELNFLMQDY